VFARQPNAFQFRDDEDAIGLDGYAGGSFSRHPVSLGKPVLNCEHYAEYLPNMQTN
jgi:hypothetical protein